MQEESSSILLNKNTFPETLFPTREYVVLKEAIKKKRKDDPESFPIGLQLLLVKLPHSLDPKTNQPFLENQPKFLLLANYHGNSDGTGTKEAIECTRKISESYSSFLDIEEGLLGPFLPVIAGFDCNYTLDHEPLANEELLASKALAHEAKQSRAIQTPIWSEQITPGSGNGGGGGGGRKKDQNSEKQKLSTEKVLFEEVHRSCALPSPISPKTNRSLFKQLQANNFCSADPDLFENPMLTTRKCRFILNEQSHKAKFKKDIFQCRNSGAPKDQIFFSEKYFEAHWLFASSEIDEKEGKLFFKPNKQDSCPLVPSEKFTFDHCLVMACIEILPHKALCCFQKSDASKVPAPAVATKFLLTVGHLHFLSKKWFRQVYDGPLSDEDSFEDSFDEQEKTVEPYRVDYPAIDLIDQVKTIRMNEEDCCFDGCFDEKEKLLEEQILHEKKVEHLRSIALYGGPYGHAAVNQLLCMRSPWPRHNNKDTDFFMTRKKKQEKKQEKKQDDQSKETPDDPIIRDRHLSSLHEMAAAHYELSRLVPARPFKENVNSKEKTNDSSD